MSTSTVQWAGRDSRGHIESVKDLSGKFCARPFKSLEIYNGSVSPCCVSWLKIRVPVRFDENGIDGTWNAEPMQALRESILDGSFRHCNHATCHLIQRDGLPDRDTVSDPVMRDIIDNNRTELQNPPEDFMLSYDRSCNLVCPSCRTSKINHTEGPQFEKSRAMQQRFVQEVLSGPSDRRFHIKITGSGDAIGSKLFRELLSGLDGAAFPNLRLTLHTNGVLLTPKWWNRLRRIHGNIREIEISVDAARERTYDVLRPGGDWTTLLDNIANLATDDAPVVMGMVVQKANFREMPDFVRLADRLGVRTKKFALVLDWGTWSRDDYEDHCIWKKHHPEFGEFLEVLADPVFDEPGIRWNNLASYRRKALAR